MQVLVLNIDFDEWQTAKTIQIVIQSCRWYHPSRSVDCLAVYSRQGWFGNAAEEPRNIALLMLADAEIVTGSRSAAIVRYRSGLDLDGSNIAALVNLAELLAPDNPNEALSLAQHAVELAPDIRQRWIP